jgi:hypothetical protein
MTLIKSFRHIAPRFQLRTQLAWLFIFVCVARILVAIPVALWRRENCVHGSIRSNQEWHPWRCESIGRFATTTASVTNKKSAAKFFFVFLGHASFSFLVKKNFVCVEK